VSLGKLCAASTSPFLRGNFTTAKYFQHQALPYSLFRRDRLAIHRDSSRIPETKPGTVVLNPEY
jgi:hypothetical protein